MEGYVEQRRSSFIGRVLAAGFVALAVTGVLGSAPATATPSGVTSATSSGAAVVPGDQDALIAELRANPNARRPGFGGRIERMF